MAKFKTKGIQIKIGIVSYAAATAIGQLGDGTLELGEREGLIDTTSHDNATGVIDQLDNGFKAPVSLNSEIFLDPSNVQHELLRSALEAGTELFVRLVLTDTGTAQWDVMMRVKSYSAPTPVKGVLKASISMEGIGASTFTA